MSINRAVLKNIRNDVDAALASVAAKYGVSISAGNARFTDTSATMKLDIATIGTNGVVKTPGRTALESRFPNYVDKVITLNTGEKAKVVEYHSRKPKYPFIVETVDGRAKRYKVPSYMVS